MALVEYDLTDRIATLTLNRPDKLNALSPSLFVELRDHVDALAGRSGDEVACVVLRGAGRSFSAGNDLDAIAAGERAPSEHHQAETIDALAALPMPVVGSVRGHCLTGGLELALGCDVIVCAEGARFADTHGRWGMTPTWGMSQRLPRRVGAARAKELSFTGRQVGGREAVVIGLAERCVPDDELDDATAALAAEIAAASPHTTRAVNALLDATDGADLADGLAHEREHSPGAGPDMEERLAAFRR